ncbi:MAG: ABC transporter ATP-binding protein [Deltaproteobacteria bacterium]|nr:ABC transporter ATP-binding protein [Deltaproteobacteria bacterium]
MRERLQESTEITNRETLRLFARALRWVWPLRRRMAVKIVLLIVGLLPWLFLTFPVKILIDHVVLGLPIAEHMNGYPGFLHPLVSWLTAGPPAAVAWRTAGVQLTMMLLFGAFGTTVRERDDADAAVAQGQDTATQTENDANVGFTLSGGLLGIFDFHWTLRLSQELNHIYRSRLFERIHSLPMSAFDDERIGDAVYRVMYDTPAITQVCYRLILAPIGAPIGIALSAWMLFTLFGDQPVIVWAALAVLPGSLLITLPFSSAYRSRGEESRVTGATTTATFEEGVHNILAVQGLGIEARQRNHFARDSEGSFAAFRGLVRIRLITTFVAILAGSVFGVYLSLQVVDLVIAGELTPGDLAVLTTYFFQMGFMAFELGGAWFMSQTSASGLHRVFFLMDLPGEEDPPGAQPLPPLREGVRFDDVHFAYEDEADVLRGASFDAPKGSFTALVGPAGAGKTTLAYLIPRFLSPTRGRVLADGRDIAEATRDSLRSQVAFVFQETVLFDATVEENIRLGNTEASEADLHRAARVAGADGFIRALPEGYATPLGRGGGKLSVGQKQRIAIARALLRDTPILILDEPTSALDPETERALVAALREASRTRLVLVIAHRLSSIREADQILFVDEGRIVERGTHQDLMAREGGAYRHFVEIQGRGAA